VQVVDDELLVVLVLLCIAFGRVGDNVASVKEEGVLGASELGEPLERVLLVLEEDDGIRGGQMLGAAL
jgi:hypothetical protein